MRVFDWERLLSEQRIAFVTSGANVKRGELNIRCPFCGSADPSYHMGINTETGWWACWRNRKQHSGKSPLRLIMRLLDVPYGRARELAGLGDDYVDPEGFDAMAAAFLRRDDKTAQPEAVERRYLELDRRFEPVTDRPRVRKFWNYLAAPEPNGRGFSGRSAAGEDATILCQLYNLQCATWGYWQDRIIIPYYQDGLLVTWTARAIGPSSARYKDLSIGESLVAPKQTLYNHDCMLEGGMVLALVEGPLDALKLDFYGRPWGVRAVALSTNSITEQQTFLLQTAVGRFERTVVMLDDPDGLGAADSLWLLQELSFLPDVTTARVPFGAKDAGALTPEQATRWAREQTKD